MRKRDSYGFRIPATTESYKVERDIPIPIDRRVAAKMPLGTMEIGDSFMVPTPEGHDPEKHVAVVRSRLANERNHFKSRWFVTRRVNGGLRIWRVK